MEKIHNVDVKKTSTFYLDRGNMNAQECLKKVSHPTKPMKSINMIQHNNSIVEKKMKALER